MELEILLAKARDRGISTDGLITILQKRCLSLVTEPGRFDDLVGLTHLMGKLPVFEGEIAQEAFQKYLAEKRFKDTKRLSELIKISPAEWIFQGAFRAYLNAEENGIDLDAIQTLSSTFNTKPSEDVVQATYLQLAKRGAETRYGEHFEKLVRLKEMTGFKPSNEVSRFVYGMHELPFPVGTSYHPAGLLSNLKTSPSFEDLQTLRNLIEETGVKPPYDEVQGIYQRMIEMGQFDSMAKLTGITDFEPSEETIQKGLKFLLLGEDFDAYRTLKKLKGVEPGEEAVQEVYISYAKRGRVSSVNRLKQSTGFEPSSGVYESLLEWLVPDEKTPISITGPNETG